MVAQDERDGWMAIDFFKTSAFAGPLFNVMHKSICTDLCKKAIGTVEHMQDRFNYVMDSGAFDAKGDKVALRRWFSWVDAATHFDRIYHMRLLCVIHWAWPVESSNMLRMFPDGKMKVNLGGRHLQEMMTTRQVLMMLMQKLHHLMQQ